MGMNISAVTQTSIFPQGLVLANRGMLQGHNTEQLAGSHSVLICVYSENMSTDGRAVSLHSEIHTLRKLQGRNTSIIAMRFVLSIEGAAAP